MRVIFVLLLLLLVFAIAGFYVSNPQTVSITLWNRTFTDIHLTMVVFLSAAFGVSVTMLIALIEGATIRLANRRQAREIHRLETELHFLRTEPAAASRVEPDEPKAGSASVKRTGVVVAEGFPPSAPVYGSDADGDDEFQDDAYTGGRAV